MNQHELILVLDFGGQYNQLIARRVRECGVYCEVHPYTLSAERIRAIRPAGIIFTGGPASVTEKSAPRCDAALFSLGIPVLGICYGHQLMCVLLGGKTSSASLREYGKASLTHTGTSPLFDGIPKTSLCWMSHSDTVSALPDGFSSVAVTDNCPFAAIESADGKLYGVQFHPEVLHTQFGKELIRNFLHNICGCKGDWNMASFAQEAVADIRKKAGRGKVLLGLSGGVDSSVCAALLSKAVGNSLTCIFVDHGFLRKNEAKEVEAVFKGQYDATLICVDASKRFFKGVAGVTDPERKRKIIGQEFIRVFEEEAKKLGAIDFLAQGTIYPDVIESGLGDAAVIKSHHNVGGLPKHMEFKGIIEPLRLLFKDEVRALGLELGLPESLVWRQPFPGPGLAVRIIGEVTEEKVEILQNADAIFREEIAAAGLNRDISQFFAVLTPIQSVGVMGDGRTYEYTLALRAVVTTDFMTAEWARIPYEVLARISSRIVNEVRRINRIVYDVTTKPPATIEWE